MTKMYYGTFISTILFCLNFEEIMIELRFNIFNTLPVRNESSRISIYLHWKKLFSSLGDYSDP